MWSCTCKLLLNTGIWIIYLATIQLGTSLVFTFYHQGHWVSPHSNLTHDTSPVLVHSQKQNLSVEWIYINTVRKQKADEHANNQARQHFRFHSGPKRSQWSERWCERLRGHAQGLTSHNGSNVYSRQLSFLPTIMREIESQEMFVFLSIRPNNNIIPAGLQKHLSSKDSPEN